MRSFYRYALGSSTYLNSGNTPFPSGTKIDIAIEDLDELMNILISHEDIITDELYKGNIVKRVTTGFKFNAFDIVKLFLHRSYKNLPTINERSINIATTIDGSKLTQRLNNVLSVLQIADQ